MPYTQELYLKAARVILTVETMMKLKIVVGKGPRLELGVDRIGTTEKYTG